MDATIALALMVKAAKVFKFDGKDDTFLSFPPNPIAFKKEQLNFASGDLSNEQALGLSEFSRIVNLIPSGLIWDPEERYLWREYQEVLYGAVDLCDSTRTPQEEADYQKALKALIQANGEDTPQLVAYNQYRDAWFNAQTEYNNKKSEAEHADAAAKKRWQEIEEPAFRARIRNVEQDWGIKGFKSLIEGAQQTFAALGAKTPFSAWEGWKAHYQPIIDEKTDTNGQKYAWSGFLPANALDTSSWLTLTLTSSEVSAFINEAPAELRTRFGPNSLRLDVESISFDYSSVKITRPWFDSELFNARFWKFYDSSRSLSDGKTPARGTCPSYVTALIFARNLKIKFKSNSPKNEDAVKQLQGRSAISLGGMRMNVSALTAALKPTLLPSAATLSASRPTVAAIQPLTALSRENNPVSGSSNLRGLTSKKLVRSVAFRQARMKSTSFQRIKLMDIKLPLGTPPLSSVPSPLPVTNEDELYVLAFICKRLPRCPNPDTTLKW